MKLIKKFGNGLKIRYMVYGHQKKQIALMEHLCLNALCRNGTPENVFRQYLKCGYSRDDLLRRFYVIDERNESKSPLPHPFVTACENGNLPVVKLFLLLGMMPNAQVMENNQTPLSTFTANRELHEVLADDTPWLDRRFSMELARIMEGQPEACIREGHVLQMLIYGFQGLKITDCGILFTQSFKELSVLAQAFVCRMLMTPRQREDVDRLTKKNHGRKHLLSSAFQLAIEDDSDANVEKRRKVIDSAALLSEATLNAMVDSMFSDEERITLLNEIMEIPDVFHTNRLLWRLKEKQMEHLVWRCSIKKQKR